ncbi:unnamed protein product [Arabidopsis halleri]
MAESFRYQANFDSLDELSDGDFDLSYEAISSLLITSKNSHLPLPEQGVSVEYLPESQKLQIPAAMGMSWTPTNTKLCETNPTLYSRFWKVASMSYTEIEALVKTKTPATFREAIDGLEMMTPVSERPTWLDTTTEADADATFGNLSKVLQFNCDIRDFGYLLTENATVTDTAWSNNVENVPSARLQNKLKPYTLRMIAALNLAPVGNYPLGGWIRAYGLGVGIYPSCGSAFQVEAVYTTKMPSTDDETAAVAFEQSYGEILMNLCLNILAIFGLFHLRKDKTYVKGNKTLNGIANSYLETLKIADTENMMMTNHKKCLVHIAPHPFGIAQTYWLAKVMYKHQLLMPLLASFHYTTPPRVQRIMVILSAAREWENLPAGQDVLEMFSDKLARLKTQEIAIKEAPPRYSDLYRFYGCEKKMEISGEIWSDVIALMPATYGFAMVAHVSEDGKKKDGIALARCVMNVERDMKKGGIFWKKLWRSKLQASSK